MPTNLHHKTQIETGGAGVAAAAVEARGKVDVFIRIAFFPITHVFPCILLPPEFSYASTISIATLLTQEEQEQQEWW